MISCENNTFENDMGERDDPELFTIQNLLENLTLDEKTLQSKYRDALEARHQNAKASCKTEVTKSSLLEEEHVSAMLRILVKKAKLRGVAVFPVFNEGLVEEILVQSVSKKIKQTFMTAASMMAEREGGGNTDADFLDLLPCAVPLPERSTLTGVALALRDLEEQTRDQKERHFQSLAKIKLSEMGIHENIFLFFHLQALFHRESRALTRVFEADLSYDKVILPILHEQHYVVAVVGMLQDGEACIEHRDSSGAPILSKHAMQLENYFGGEQSVLIFSAKKRQQWDQHNCGAFAIANGVAMLYPEEMRQMILEKHIGDCSPSCLLKWRYKIVEMLQLGGYNVTASSELIGLEKDFSQKVLEQPESLNKQNFNGFLVLGVFCVGVLLMAPGSILFALDETDLRISGKLEVDTLLALGFVLGGLLTITSGCVTCAHLFLDKMKVINKHLLSSESRSRLSSSLTASCKEREHAFDAQQSSKNNERGENFKGRFLGYQYPLSKNTSSYEPDNELFRMEEGLAGGGGEGNVVDKLLMRMAFS